MNHTYDTSFGEVEFSPAMFDLDGTNLEEGTEVRVDGRLVIEDHGSTASSFSDLSTEEVEEYLLKKGI